MAGSRHVGDFFQKRNILGMLAKLIVADQGAKGRASKHPVLFLIDLLEQRALVELHRLLEVFNELLLGNIQHPNLQHGAGLALIDEVVQAPPGSLKLLEIRTMQDLIELLRNERVDLRDPGIDHRFGVLGDDDLSLENLPGKLSDDVAGQGAICGILPSSFVNDFVQQGLSFRCLLARGACSLRFSLLIHCHPPCLLQSRHRHRRPRPPS